jgi:hypothetical protein
MQLNQYEWSGNPRGMHNEGAFRPIFHDRYLRTKMGWYKFVCGGEEFAQDAGWMLSNNITPIIRIYRATPGAEPVTDGVRQLWEIYRSWGCKWFEFYNEPNFAEPEWPESQRSMVSPYNIDGVIRPLCENWMNFAEIIINMGAYPAFPALGETSGESGAVQWMDAMLGFMRDNYRDRFINIANNGLWWATHPYSLNHFYQEVPGQPTVPRQPEAQNVFEAGWRFEYPWDPYTQSFAPGRDVFPGGSAPFGDPNGIIAMGVALNKRLAEWFGVNALPVVGTEGGIYPLPISEPYQQPDARFPRYDRRSHGEATAAMFNWIPFAAPEWMFGICLWKEDEYYNNNFPAIQRLEEVPQIRRGEPWPVAPGGTSSPAFVVGEPDFHFVVLAPGLETSWFFDSAQAYWNRFRPTLTSSWAFFDFIPPDRSLAATVIAPPDMADTMRQSIQERYPAALFDLLITSGDLNTVSNVLNARVWADRRFG